MAISNQIFTIDNPNHIGLYHEFLSYTPVFETPSSYMFGFSNDMEFCKKLKTPKK